MDLTAPGVSDRCVLIKKTPVANTKGAPQSDPLALLLARSLTVAARLTHHWHDAPRNGGAARIPVAGGASLEINATRFAQHRCASRVRHRVHKPKPVFGVTVAGLFVKAVITVTLREKARL